ncbi:MAG: 3-keto-5-aminohexanoate cleavage protein [Deltaproteobacteria bacterium]|nr:3-keto-5-aminohexanoate cleavage protein [Deltaproteobacteria bacterium]
MNDKVVITCAMSGAVTSRAQCPAIPYSLDDYASEAKRAFEAGAAVVHIHARDDDGQPSYSPERFAAIGDAIRRVCPIILNFSTGTIDPEVKLAPHVKLYRPEIGAVNMGSMNYAKYNSKRKSWVFNFVFENRFDDIQALLTMMNDSGVKPELECFDTGHVHSVEPLIDMGFLKPPLDFSLVMGVVGGIKATARHLAFQAENLPPESTWKVVGISRDQWTLCAAALSLGGNVRVGLEDNFYLPNGEMARSNGDLVAKATQMALDTGRSIATVAEARRILGLAVVEQKAEV